MTNPTTRTANLKFMAGRSHAGTHCYIYQNALYLACKRNALDAYLTEKEEVPNEYKALIQSWAIMYIPHENAYLLRNAFGVFLGWEDDTFKVGASNGMEPEQNYYWKIVPSTVEPTGFNIKSTDGNKFLTSLGATLQLAATETTLSRWNFDISTTVPPGQ